MTAEISICICTFRRPALLRRLLESLRAQRPAEIAFRHGCVVVDNDPAGTAREVAAEFPDLVYDYQIEPERGFPAVRNRALALARGDFIAFIDDDEYAGLDWLATLLRLQRKTGAQGVLGPVRPYFEPGAPSWLIRSRICERASHPTGLRLTADMTRTGNVLLQRELCTVRGLAFDPAYRTGGEDVDFFRRAISTGAVFVWCEEAPVFELVPAARANAVYHLRRALLLGQISGSSIRRSSSPGRRARKLLSCVAGTLGYAAVTPFFLLAGRHQAIKPLLKGCHHLSRLCCLLGFPLMHERNF